MIRIRQTDGNIVVTNERKVNSDLMQITPIFAANSKFALAISVYWLIALIMLIFALLRPTTQVVEAAPKEYKASVVSLPYIADVEEEEPDDFLEVYAGRNSEATSDYNSLGLPTDRIWLTAKEWQGKHIETYELKARFKAWKQIHIAEWVQYITNAAKEEAKHYPEIPWQLIAAQATLESGFGLSEVAVKGRNLFGHKCYNCDADKGEAVIAHDDSPDDHFRVNNSKWASIRSHSKLLMRSYYPRIKTKKPTLDNWLNALCGCQTTKGSKKFVDKGGYVYATSCYSGSKYTSKIKSVINQYFSE